MADAAPAPAPTGSTAPAPEGWEGRLAAERSALRRVAAAVVTGGDATAALGLAAAEVASLMDAEQGFVFRFEGRRVVIAGAWGVEQSPVGAEHEMLETGVIPQVFASGEPVRVEGRLRPLGRENSTQFWIAPVYKGGIGAPVYVGERLWGVMVAATIRDDPFPAGAESRLAYFAEVAGIAIGNAEANERLARLAMSDPLTGLANHRAFHSSLAVECERARRHGRPLALAMIDVDHFKRVNDMHGHLAGDHVLTEVGERLTASARAGDLVARVGGEEFAWLLPETDLEGARHAAERARAAMAARPFPEVGPLTVSVGVAELSQAEGPRELYRLADDALYWAKRTGRDRACVYGPGMDAEAPAPGLGDGSPTLAVVRALARAIDAKDPVTRAHSERVARVAERMALRSGWTLERAAALGAAALVHDVGKIGVSDAALLKRGPLDQEEYAAVKRHAGLGAEIVAEVMSADQVSWIRGHHERWAGGGYPDGLAGEAIPAGARMLAVADAWDVMTVARPYAPPRTWDDALAELRRECGRQFCPSAVAALEAVVSADGDLELGF
jgi:diguanylate cyclase (GGDEF)-like protein